MQYCPLCMTTYENSAVKNFPKIKIKGHAAEGGYQCPKRGCFGVILDIDEMMIPIIDFIFREFHAITLFCCSGHYVEQHSNPYVMIKYDENNNLCHKLFELYSQQIDPCATTIASKYNITIDFDEDNRNSTYLGCDGEEYFVEKAITIRLPYRSLDKCAADILSECKDIPFLNLDDIDPYDLKISARLEFYKLMLSDYKNLALFLQKIKGEFTSTGLVADD